VNCAANRFAMLIPSEMPVFADIDQLSDRSFFGNSDFQVTPSRAF